MGSERAVLCRQGSRGWEIAQAGLNIPTYLAPEQPSHLIHLPSITSVASFNMARLFGLFLVLLGCVATTIAALDLPSNVKDFYDHVRGKGKCDNVLKGGFHSSDGDSGGTLRCACLLRFRKINAHWTPDFGYCGDYLDDYKIMHLQGKDGQLVNMDIDCDGTQNGPGSDGRCQSSTDTQSETTFRDDFRGYGTGQRDLNAFVHPYVVFGNEGTKKGWPTFDPQKNGVKPLSVMAVICNNKLVSFESLLLLNG